LLAITRLSLHYPHSKIEMVNAEGALTAHARVIAEDWHEEFQHLNEQQFQAAVKLARSRCKFFPTIADVNEAVTDLREKYRERRQIERDTAKTIQITEAPSYKDELTIAKNQKRLEILNRMMLKEISGEQAEKEMAEL
jgi:hypothetical protein